MDFAKTDKKWQKKWESGKAFEAKENSKKEKCYVLEMYPYPSGSGLHMGHAFNYTIGDIYARFRRMSGKNVLYPMGFDSFGLPAENAAIKANTHPKKYTDDAIRNFVKQQKALGLSYDWSRTLKSSSPDFYKWNQYLFLKFYEKGLVYRKKGNVNWCKKCDTVLANEQVHKGYCWRHSDVEVETKQLEQWFIKTTNYAEQLLRDLDKLDWPKRIKIMQENWLGKSEGSEIDFIINGKPWGVFTTRPDTLFGVTFLVMSAQHPELMDVVSKEQKSKIKQFLKKIRSTKQEEMDNLEKEGVFSGSYAKNPFTGDEVPIWVGNFVVADYGSGVVMAVPAHDQRDFDFARKYHLPIKVVISKDGNEIPSDNLGRAYTDEGVLINSEQFNGLQNREARKHVTNALKEKKLGRETTQYKLRDWLISRQRYWGTPIPMVYCSQCGIVPVPEKELPVKLPENVKFGKGNPLQSNKNFVDAKCPKCGGKARRETDTMDTFFDSSWYYLRYCDSKNARGPFDSSKTKYWMPVDTYIGGAEHAVMHLIYARFFTKVLRDLGLLDISEPFPRLFNQGMVHGEDGSVMAKSRGNVIDPLKISVKYGADTLRLFLVSMASPDKDFAWDNKGVEGSWRFLNKVVDAFGKIRKNKSSAKAAHKVNKAIKQISSDIEGFRYNFAVIGLRQVFETLSSEKEIAQKDLESCLKLLAPFCPHVAEELWSKLGKKSLISLSDWPIAEEKKINDDFDKAEEAVERTVLDIMNILKIVGGGKKVFLYALPNEVEFYSPDEISKRVGRDVAVFAVNDKKKYDPNGKAKKAKPGKPAIYIE